MSAASARNHTTTLKGQERQKIKYKVVSKKKINKLFATDDPVRVPGAKPL